MEIQSINLIKRLTNEKDDGFVYKLFNEIMNVLENLKIKGLFHMDIKPVNILMKLKLIAKIEDAINVDYLLNYKTNN